MHQFIIDNLDYILVGLLVITTTVLYIVNRRYHRQKKLANDNLGKPAELNEAEEKLGGIAYSIKCWVPNDPNPSVVSEMKTGVGLLYHEFYPSKPIFIKMVFKFEEQVSTDSKIVYMLDHTTMGITYLRRMKATK